MAFFNGGGGERKHDGLKWMQPKVTPRAVGRSQFERAPSGQVFGFVGEPAPGDTPRSGQSRDQLRDPESARRRAEGVLRRAPSCADPKTDGWSSAAQGLSHGQLEKQPLYANPR
jgi:hypothetical protein